MAGSPPARPHQRRGAQRPAFGADAAEWQGYACLTVMGPDERNWLSPGTAPSREACARARAVPLPRTGRRAGRVRPRRPLALRLRSGAAARSVPTLHARLPLLMGFLRTTALEPGDWVKLIQSVNLYAGDCTPGAVRAAGWGYVPRRLRRSCAYRPGAHRSPPAGGGSSRCAGGA